MLQLDSLAERLDVKGSDPQVNIRRGGSRGWSLRSGQGGGMVGGGGWGCGGDTHGSYCAHDQQERPYHHLYCSLLCVSIG